MVRSLKEVTGDEIKAVQTFGPLMTIQVTQKKDLKKKIFVVSDLHGVPELYNPVFDRILGVEGAHGVIPDGSVVIFNGDCIGARGPELNKIAKAYYDYKESRLTSEDFRKALGSLPGKLARENGLLEVARMTASSGEFFAALRAVSLEFYEFAESDVMLASGNFLSRLFDAAKRLEEAGRDIQMIVMSGNSENVTICDMLPLKCSKGNRKPECLKDFVRYDMGKVVLKPKSQRFRSQFFNIYNKEHGGVLFVDGFHYVDDVLLVGAGVVEQMMQANCHMLKTLDQPVNTIVCHYPPVLDKKHKHKMGVGAKIEWNAEENEILNLVAVAQKSVNAKDASVDCQPIQMVFGSYHPGLVEEELNKLNKIEKFSQSIPENDTNVKCTWVRPGVIHQLKA